MSPETFDPNSSVVAPVTNAAQSTRRALQGVSAAAALAACALSAFAVPPRPD